jgi:hypothetical protein
MSKNVKSILTEAMLNADKADAETEPETITLGEKMIADLDRKAARKQFLKKAAIVTLAGCALAYVAGRLSASSGDGEDADTTTED